MRRYAPPGAIILIALQRVRTILYGFYYIQSSGTCYIIDENVGYQIAKRAGLQVVRTLSILLKTKEQGLLTALKPLLDEMILKGRWYSNHVYQEFLTRAGEL